MSKSKNKQLQPSEPLVYENLRLDVLQKLADERDILCKNKKDEIIRNLKLDDEGKYVRETTHEKSNDGFIIGVDIKNTRHLIELGKLIEKKEAKNIHRYASNMLYYWSKERLI